MFKILYLEDNEVDVDLTRIELKKSFPGCIIKIARTIAEAFAILKDDPEYNIAILDVNLPDGSGIEVLLYIRQMQLPIVTLILTSSGNEEIAIAALKAGADDYLPKNQGYYNKLANNITSAIESFKENIEKLSKPLHVLYVEWNKSDVDFTLRHMKQYAPYIHIDVVSSAEEALAILPETMPNKCEYDVLLMDYKLHGLNALDTIKIIRKERNLPISIVIVTGHGSEDIAVQLLKIGAYEYLVKRKNYLFRLPSVLTNAYQQKILEQRQNELRESEAKYRLLAENSTDVIFTLDLNFKFIYISPSVKELRGFLVEEAINENLSEVLTPDSFKKAMQLFASFDPLLNELWYTEIGMQVLELEMIKKDGTTVWTEVKVTVLANDDKIPIGIQGAVRDISKHRTALDELYKSREEYRSFFEDDLTGDFISTVEGKLLNCNQAYLQILGFSSKEQALNYDLKKLRVNENEWNEMLLALRKNKRLISYEHNLVRTDGETIHAIANIIGGFDISGELKTIKGYIIDDTERKKANDEIRKLSRAMEQSPASIVITDLDGNIEYTNPIFSKKTGYSFEEVKGKNPRILKSGKISNEIFEDLWRTITAGYVWTGEFLNKRKDGKLYWESASISPVKNENGETTHYLAVKEDITEKKKYEEELIVARNQADESSRLKSAFLATMSHELRTPLNAIIGFSDLIDENMELREILNYVKIINNSGSHLLKIIEDIFSVSLLQTGHSKVVVEEFQLSDFFKSLIQYSKAELRNKNKLNLNFKFQDEGHDTLIKLKSDKTKIYQVLINYVKNAIEFTGDGDIEIGFYTEDESIVFYVKDTGIGIQKDKIEIIFERFRQIDDSHSREHGGVGLGLAICSEIAKLLKGNVWVESVYGKGSTFFFSLNNIIISNSEKTGNVAVEETYPDYGGKNILIVEDDENNYFLLENYLSKTRANIMLAETGEESIEICKSNQNIDLVLMDIRLPGIDGLEAAMKIKEFRPQLIIIAQTAFALANDRKIAINSKCNDYISKPIFYKDLINVLSKYLA